MKDLMLSPEALVNQQMNLQHESVLIQELINDSLSKYELEKLYQIQNLIHKTILSETSLNVIKSQIVKEV